MDSTYRELFQAVSASREKFTREGLHYFIDLCNTAANIMNRLGRLVESDHECLGVSRAVEGFVEGSDSQ